MCVRVPTGQAGALAVESAVFKHKQTRVPHAS